jgi:multidrug resistance efflux pump
MHRWKFSVLLGLLLFLLAASAFPMTCDECKNLDKKIALTNQEMATLHAQLQSAYSKNDFSKANRTQKRLAELSRKLVKLQGSKNANCQDACDPEVVKKTECGQLLSEIADMEADAQSAEANREKIDKKYEALLECHRELQQFLKKK